MQRAGLPRFLPVFGLIVLLSAVGAEWSRDGDPATAWARLGLFTYSPPFADLRCLTSAYDCQRRGIDTLRANPCDPWRRIANYPRLWNVGRSLGLGSRHTVPLGIALWVVFVAAVAALSSLLPPGFAGGLVTTCFVVSPACLLALERGNNDILVLALTLLGAHLLWRGERGSWAGSWAGAVLILVATALKYFPLFSLWGFRHGSRSRRLIIPVGLSALLFLLFSWSDLLQIARSTPRPRTSAFGIWVFSHSLAKATFGVRGGWLGFAIAVWLVAATYAATLRFRRLARMPAALREPSALPAESLPGWLLRLFSPLFCGVYFLGASFNYRLIFFLPIVPGLLHLARAGGRSERALAWAMLAAGLYAFWGSAFEKDLRHTDEIAVLALVLALLAVEVWGALSRVSTAPSSPAT